MYSKYELNENQILGEKAQIITTYNLKQALKNPMYLFMPPQITENASFFYECIDNATSLKFGSKY